MLTVTDCLLTLPNGEMHPIVWREIPLNSTYFLKQVDHLLTDNELNRPPLDYLIGMYDEETDELLACGGLGGSTIQCVAVSPAARSLNLAGKIVTLLLTRASQAGLSNVTVFTKPENKALFISMGFHLVAQAQRAIMLEHDRRALKRYVDYLTSLQRGGVCGAIVMNANPLTRGHLYLINRAREQVDHLFIILVADNPHNLFSYAERHEILEKAVQTMNNVTLVEGSIYSVSAATFPSYFIKEKSAVSATHIELDLNLFAEHLAPALKVSKRFVGSEPDDELTAAYNEGMHRLLPTQGIEVIEIPRCKQAAEDNCISASRLRKALTGGKLLQALDWAAPESVPFIWSKAATTALQAELDLTPKPGLVDRHNSGAHSDMDYALMRSSICALGQSFCRIAEVASHTPTLPDCKQLAAIGREGEQQMLKATRGVNTHKGALFAMGLTLAAAVHLHTTKQPLNTQHLQNTIARLAACFTRPADTHGATIHRQYGVPGALDNARTGYAQLFNQWLPFWKQQQHTPDALYRLLLYIMSTLDDTNVLHRVGNRRAAEVKSEAKHLLENFTLNQLEQLDRIYIEQNISPGGAADMLALTLFIAAVCTE